MDGLSEVEKATVTKLTGLGLPEGQAIKSAKALATPFQPSPSPSTAVACMKIKEGTDMAALKASLVQYGAASKKSAGKVFANYGMDEAKMEIQFFEVFNSPGAMDAHIGNCFEFFVQLVPHTEMKDIMMSAEPSEVAWWTESGAAWGAERYSVIPNV